MDSNMEMAGISRGIGRQHLIAGVVAGILSLGLHIMALVWLSGMELQFSRVTSDLVLKQRKPALRMQRVEREPTESPATPKKKAGGGGDASVSLLQKVASLGMEPEKSVLEPPPVLESKLAGDTANIEEPSSIPERKTWPARQEILSIQDRLASKELLDLPRREIPSVERVERAPDIGPAITPDRLKAQSIKPEDVSGAGLSRAEIEHSPQGSIEDAVLRELAMQEPAAEDTVPALRETGSEVTGYKPVEDLLTAAIETYGTPRDREYSYCRVTIRRIGPEELPVLPKDILFVQDCSASMSEKRLYFCRNGLRRCLPLLRADDRFNVYKFREKVDSCYKAISEVSPETLKKAEAYIDGMEAGGNTDIFRSVKELLKEKKTPGRPLIAFLVSDGYSTEGVTVSSEIIGEFTKLNDGMVSTFTLGTLQTANWYLLDLLSYCNGGQTYATKGGRWGIPDSMVHVMEEIGRPVLTDLAFRFSRSSRCEAYPLLVGNLYLDRDLVLYGRYPRGQDRIIFQAIGRAGDVKCDMVFDVALTDESAAEDPAIRENWARQKVYHLIGLYDRTPTPDILRMIQSTARAYRIRIPHRGEF